MVQWRGLFQRQMGTELDRARGWKAHCASSLCGMTGLVTGTWVPEKGPGFEEDCECGLGHVAFEATLGWG